MSDDPKPAEPTAQDPAPEPAPTETALEKRLSTIMGVTNELRQNDQNRNTELADLKNLVVGLSQKLDAPATPPVGAPSANTPTDPFSSPAPADPATSNPQSFQDAVQEAVQKQLAPILEASTAQNEKLKKHQAAFGQVTETDPEFATPGSREKSLFDKIYGARPDLQQLDDAPLVVANIVRGIVADERLQAQNVELAKARTTLPAAGGRPAPEGAPEQVREALAALVRKGETEGNLTPKEMGDYLNLATAVAHLDE